MSENLLSPQKVICLLALGGSLLFMGTPPSTAADGHGPSTIILKTAKAKKPATFPHALHQEKMPCATCHHGKNKDGKQRPLADNEKKQKCVSCHNKSMENKKLNSLKKAGHARCKSCHKAMKKARQKTGPTKCTGCHIKK